MNTTTQNTNISKETPSDESLRLAKLFILGHAHKEPWDEKEVADVIRAAVRIDAEFASILADNQRLRLQHEGDAQIIRQLDGQIAELREQVGQLREALSMAWQRAATHTLPFFEETNVMRSALSAVERGMK